MKKIKTNRGLRLLALVLCLAMFLTACGGQSSTETGETEAGNEANYQVTVTDALGNPYTTGIVVAFLQNGQQVAMQTVDANGVAAKTLEKGDYTVELMFTGDESGYYYDKSADLSLSADKTELTVTLANALNSEPTTLTVEGEERAAYPVSEGCTYVTLTAGERNYFLFTPTVAGTYEFSTGDAAAAIGYYGAPHFVQSQNAAEVVDNTFTISVSAGMIGAEGASGTSVLVIGVEGGADSTILNVSRIGDAEWSVTDEPWTIYQPTVELAAYTLPAGARITEFDLTSAADAYNLVLGGDGFYHLDSADGPLVLVRLGEKSAYLDPYKTIVEHTGVKKYFYDENGEFVKKEDYTECVMKYLECIDEDSGTYPLTEDLKYIIQNHGDHSGWYDSEGVNYLFKDQDGNVVPGINAEISWLFMCCYIAG